MLKMKNTIFILFTIFVVSCSSSDALGKTDTWKVYYMGGQSNMDGYGFNSELPESLNTTFENVMIFDGNRVNDAKNEGGQGKWSNLKPGHGLWIQDRW